MTTQFDIIDKDLPRDRVFARHPTLIGVVLGVKFYECPIHGDERPLIAVTKNQCGYSHWWDLPTPEELSKRNETWMRLFKVETVGE